MPEVVQRQTRKGERFLDPRAVALYTKDFTLDTVTHLAPPEAHTQETARQLPVAAGDETYAQRLGDSWEGHYRSNTGLYPVKNYIAQAFPSVFLEWAKADESAATERTHHVPRLVLECGCGVGSALLPLASLLPADRFVGFDVSKSAVDKMNNHERVTASGGRIEGFVHDAAMTDLPERFRGTSDAVILVFVLSAIGRSRQLAALQRLHGALKPTGILCFRDYGRFDHNERRFFDNGNKVADGGYVKGDGTQQCFFELEATRALFAAAGLVEVVPLEYHCNRVANRKTGVEMRKVFINGVFRPKDVSALATV
jgi:methyltransferase-like protein 6